MGTCTRTASGRTWTACGGPVTRVPGTLDGSTEASTPMYSSVVYGARPALHCAGVIPGPWVAQACVQRCATASATGARRPPAASSASARWAPPARPGPPARRSAPPSAADDRPPHPHQAGQRGHPDDHERQHDQTAEEPDRRVQRPLPQRPVRGRASPPSPDRHRGPSHGGARGRRRRHDTPTVRAGPVDAVHRRPVDQLGLHRAARRPPASPVRAARLR